MIEINATYHADIGKAYGQVYENGLYLFTVSQDGLSKITPEIAAAVLAKFREKGMAPADKQPKLSD